MENKHIVAVYGTLKKGKRNERIMNSIYHEFVGRGKTIEKYPLVVSQLPYLFKNEGIGHRIEVEVYKVDDCGLDRLDKFEGHPSFYIRKQIECELENGEKLICHIYFINRIRDDFDKFNLQETF